MKFGVEGINQRIQNRHDQFRGGILDGFAGLVLCATMAYYTFLKDAQLWALHRAADSEDQSDSRPSGMNLADSSVGASERRMRPAA